MQLKIFGTRLGGYSTHTPQLRPLRYGEYMRKSPLNKTEQTPNQLRNDKIFSSLSLRIKEWLGLGQ